MAGTRPTARQARDALDDAGGRLRAGDIASLLDLGQPGIYAWFVDPPGARDLQAGLGFTVAAGLIYAGQAGAGSSSATLGSRIRANHLGGNIYGSTFRLTLASVLRESLALEPIGGRRMTRDGEARLSAWMRAHLKVSVVRYPDRRRLDSFETEVLDLLDPPLNIAKRPSTPTRTRLSGLRRTFMTTPTAASTARRVVEGPNQLPSAAAVTRQGLTPEQLARELGLADAKSVRALLRRTFPRPAAELWSRWEPLSPEMERAVRARFGGRG